MKIRALINKIVFFTLVFSIGFFLFYSQIYQKDKGYKSDFRYDMKRVYAFEAGYGRSYPGFLHMVSLVKQVSFFFRLDLLFTKFFGYSPEESRETVHNISGIFTLSTFLLSVSLVIHFILTGFLRDLFSENIILVLTGVLMIVSAIYVPFFNKNIYVGQGSPNIWHNPNMISLKPFAFLAFYYFVRFIKNEKYREMSIYMISISLLLLAGSYIKPSFAISFLPAIFLFLLLKHFKRIDLYLKAFIVCVPVTLLLSRQYILHYKEVELLSNANIEETRIIIDLLKLWSQKSPNVFISICLALGFPISIFFFRFRETIKNDYLFLSWNLMVIGILQAAIFAEGGPSYYHGNFFWAYSLALQVVFIYSTVEFMNWISQNIGHQNHVGINFPDIAMGVRRMFQEKDRRMVGVKILIAFSALTLHLVSGSYYFLRILLGGSYR